MLRELNEVSSLLSDAQTRPDQAPSLARQAQEMIQTIITQEEDAHGI